MMTSDSTHARIAQYQLAIDIDAPRKRVWELLTQDTNAWWLPSFRMLEDSEVTFQAEAGGQLIEKRADGASLLWYTVHMVVPGKSLHLVGQSFPEWGGPVTTMLRLTLVERDGGCTLDVSDALTGSTSEEQVASLSGGWKQLFGDGLKAHAEGR